MGMETEWGELGPKPKLHIHTHTRTHNACQSCFPLCLFFFRLRYVRTFIFVLLAVQYLVPERHLQSHSATRQDSLPSFSFTFVVCHTYSRPQHKHVTFKSQRPHSGKMDREYPKDLQPQLSKGQQFSLSALQTRRWRLGEGLSKSFSFPAWTLVQRSG